MGKATLTLDLVEDDFLLLNGVLWLPTLSAEEFPGHVRERLGERMGDVFPLPARWREVLGGMTDDASRPTLYGVGIDLRAGVCAASNGHHLYMTPLARQAEIDIDLPVISARAAVVVVRLPSASGQLYQRRFTTEERALLTSDDPQYRVRREDLTVEQRRAQFVVVRAPSVTLWSTLPALPFPD